MGKIETSYPIYYGIQNHQGQYSITRDWIALNLRIYQD